MSLYQLPSDMKRELPIVHPWVQMVLCPLKDLWSSGVQRNHFETWLLPKRIDTKNSSKQHSQMLNATLEVARIDWELNKRALVYDKYWFCRVADCIKESFNLFPLEVYRHFFLYNDIPLYRKSKKNLRVNKQINVIVYVYTFSVKVKNLKLPVNYFYADNQEFCLLVRYEKETEIKKCFKYHKYHWYKSPIVSDVTSRTIIIINTTCEWRRAVWKWLEKSGHELKLKTSLALTVNWIIMESIFLFT